jgi:hypothetical protein
MSTTPGTLIVDIIASVGFTSVEPKKLKNGKWRAYLYTESPHAMSNPRAYSCPYDREVVRDNYGYIINAPSREELITKLKMEYPRWKWST